MRIFAPVSSRNCRIMAPPFPMTPPVLVAGQRMRKRTCGLAAPAATTVGGDEVAAEAAEVAVGWLRRLAVGSAEATVEESAGRRLGREEESIGVRGYSTD